MIGERCMYWMWWHGGPRRRHIWWWLAYLYGASPIPPPPPGTPGWYWLLEIMRSGYRIPIWPHPYPPRDAREELEYLKTYREALERDLRELQDELKSVEERIRELEERLKKG